MRPLTLEQAQHIGNTYHFLEGTPYDQAFSENTTPIQAVLIVPFNEKDQEDFIDGFDMLGYPDLKPYDPQKGYDVVALARYSPDEEICVWMDIRSFVKKNIKQVANYHKAYLSATNHNTEVFA